MYSQLIVLQIYILTESLAICNKKKSNLILSLQWLLVYNNFPQDSCTYWVTSRKKTQLWPTVIKNLSSDLPVQTFLSVIKIQLEGTNDKYNFPTNIFHSEEVLSCPSSFQRRNCFPINLKTILEQNNTVETCSDNSVHPVFSTIYKIF